MKKVLVTGGAGFIGSHLADALCSAGCKVKVIDNLSTGHLSNLAQIKDRIEFVKGNITDRDLVLETIKGCDAVFHQAAVVSVTDTVARPIESAMVNDLGALIVLEAARLRKVKRVVLASSCAVYGDSPELPKHEGMAPMPRSPYAVQKLAGELYSKLYHELYGVETVCLRYFNVYGPRQDPSSPYSGVISIFLTKAADNAQPTIYGDGSQYRDFIFVADVVKANLLAARGRSAPGQRLNIGTGKTVSIKTLWQKIAALTKANTQPIHADARPGDIHASVADIDKAKAVLGFNPEHSFEQGLGITCDWYKDRSNAE